MGYIGSTWNERYYTQTPDAFVVSSAAQSVFNLSRPVSSVNSIQVWIDENVLPYVPLPSDNPFYRTSGSTLTLTTPVMGVTVLVIYLTTSEKVITPVKGSITVNSIAAIGFPTGDVFLRGDGSWSGIGIPINNQNGNYTLQASDNGKCVVQISENTSDITIALGVFAIGDSFLIYNIPDTSTLPQNLVYPAGITVLKPGAGALPSPFSIAQGGLMQLLCVGINTFVITGTNGLGGN